MDSIVVESQQLPKKWSAYRGWKAKSLEEAKAKLNKKYPWWFPENVVIYPTEKDSKGNVLEAHYYFPTEVDTGF